MSQVDFDAHYDATAARGLCWNGDGKPVYVYESTPEDGVPETIETLWCFECWADLQADIVTETPC